MFRNIVVALAVSEASAITHKHHHHKHHHTRPYPGTAPWHEPYVVEKGEPLDNKPSHYYTVPAIGFENDLIPKNNRMPWTYPTSLTQARSDPICSSAGCTQYEHPKPPAGPPMDYPVPSFGADPDIEGTANSLDIAEKMFKHKIIMGTEESKAKWHNVAKDVDYNFAPALDGDIITSQKNLVNAENTLGYPMGYDSWWS